MWAPPDDIDTTMLWRAIEAAADQVSIGIFVIQIDATPRVLYVSERTARLVGRRADELIGGTPWALLAGSDPDQSAIRSLIATRDGSRPLSLALAVPRPDGTLAQLELGLTRMHRHGRIFTVGYVRDAAAERFADAAVTEREALHHKLARADRLSALGTLSAGIAHEINNPLTYAQLSIQRVERLLADPRVPDELAQTVRDHLADVQAGITRVASITASLRTFARADDAPPGPADLVGALEGALKMVDNDVRHRAQLVRELPADTSPTVTGNASRLEQVFVNLLINAVQALPIDDVAHQRITVAVAQTTDAATVTIRDTGHGIPAALHDRVFEAFFTTKPIGEGTGIGLAVCKSIVESFGGRIELTSAEGAGTTVTVHLPLHRGDAAIESSPATAPVAATRRRVLVVDDDDLVRRALANLLSQHHQITPVASGTDALAALHAAPFDAILCDMMMPGMNGLDVYRSVAAAHPGLEHRIIFITGGTFAPLLDEFLDTCRNPYLVKPFTLDPILAAIAQVTTVQ